MTSTIPFQRISITALLGSVACCAGRACTASAAEIDREADEALEAFRKIEGADAFLGIAKGVLVFPKVYKAGIGVGGEYGWKVGVDGSVALVDIGVGKTVDTTNTKDPVIGFIFGQRGLMYNLTLEGSKFTKLQK